MDLSNGVQDLARALEYIRPRAQGRFELPDEEAEAAAAALSLLRTMVVHAEANLHLASTPFAEAASANLRAMFEAWIQLRYLLTRPDRREAALRYKIFGLFEFRDYLVTTEADPEDLAVLQEEIRTVQRAELGVVEHVERLRSGKLGGSKYYWTGMGPTALVKEVGKHLGDDDQLVRFYKYASWDAHHVLTTVLDVSQRSNGGTPHIQFGPRQPPPEAAAFSCGVAARMLGDAWTLTIETLRATAEPIESPGLSQQS